MIVTSQQLLLHWNHTLTSKKDDIQAQHSVYVDISTGEKKNSEDAMYASRLDHFFSSKWFYNQIGFMFLIINVHVLELDISFQDNFAYLFKPSFYAK